MTPLFIIPKLGTWAVARFGKKQHLVYPSTEDSHNPGYAICGYGNRGNRNGWYEDTPVRRDPRPQCEKCLKRGYQLPLM